MTSSLIPRLTLIEGIKPLDRRPFKARGVIMIPLFRGGIAICDLRHFEEVMPFTWGLVGRGAFYYIRRAYGPAQSRKCSYLHRIVGQSSAARMSWYNGDHLDCRDDNLLHLTQREMRRIAMKTRRERFGSIGVVYHPASKRWRAEIGTPPQRCHLGSFLTKEEAQRAYDRAAIAEYGDEAVLNLPEEHGR